ncbi:MAG TPA: methyltransferase [Vicinamibacterales bacterium]|nr:methyltransferase [Vicinamibacterales bacterium]
MSRAPVAFAWIGGALFVAALLYFLFFYLIELGRPAVGSGWVRPLALDTGIFALFAVHHSVMARTAVKSWLAAIVSPGLERSIFVWISSILLIAVCVFWQGIPGVAYSVRDPWRWGLYAVQLAGVLLTVRASARLDVLELAGVRQARGANRSKAVGMVGLQMTGPYTLVRHPVYLGWVAVVFGAPHMTADRLALATISTVYLIIGTAFEERALETAFGESYRQYRRQVRWRFLPGLY